MFTSVDVRLHRAGQKTIGGRVASGLPVLLLTTAGRQTGNLRTTPLLYQLNEDGSLLLVAVNGAADWNPHWLHNLTSDPQAEVGIDGERLRVQAHVIGDEERGDLWPAALRMFPGLDHAQEESTRAIPLVRLVVQ